jgi:hypothetical protein
MPVNLLKLIPNMNFALPPALLAGSSNFMNISLVLHKDPRSEILIFRHNHKTRLQIKILRHWESKVGDSTYNRVAVRYGVYPCLSIRHQGLGIIPYLVDVLSVVSPAIAADGSPSDCCVALSESKG